MPGDPSSLPSPKRCRWCRPRGRPSTRRDPHENYFDIRYNLWVGFIFEHPQPDDRHRSRQISMALNYDDYLSDLAKVPLPDGSESAAKRLTGAQLHLLIY
jgi:hypothetical protein